jgi:hypothetical protein
MILSRASRQGNRLKSITLDWRGRKLNFSLGELLFSSPTSSITKNSTMPQSKPSTTVTKAASKSDEATPEVKKTEVVKKTETVVIVPSDTPYQLNKEQVIFLFNFGANFFFF